MGGTQSDLQLPEICNFTYEFLYPPDSVNFNQSFSIEDKCCGEQQGTIILPFKFESYYAGYKLRAVIYLIVLLWLFMGVAIIADTFMCAIEEITSQTRTVLVAKATNGPFKQKNSNVEYDKIEVRIWNDTVANLTLMALGSSAPEILLSCVEIMVNNFKAGALGPGTIVGSAAFNLLIIIAVCIVSIPSGETRRIERYTVFATTSFFSLFAYGWIYFIVKGAHSVNTIEIWEATMTFMFFPILVCIAYMADREIFARISCACVNKRRIGKNDGRKSLENQANKIALPVNEIGEDESTLSFNRRGEEDGLSFGGACMIEENQDKVISDMISQMQNSNKPLDPDEMAKLFAFRLAGKVKKSRAWYRVNATRELTGGTKVGTTAEIKRKAEAALENGLLENKTDNSNSKNKKRIIPGDVEVEFQSVEYSILEGDGKVEIDIIRKGDLSIKTTVKYETIEGSATANDDYVPVDDVLVFEPKEDKKTVTIIIIDDDEWEPDETFFIRLSLPDDSDTVNGNLCKLGKKKIAQVTEC